MSKNFFRTSAEDFKKIPGSPVAYWVSDDIRKIFATNNPLHLQMECIQGIITGNTNKYIRDWWEISQVKMLRDATAFSDEKHWIPYTAGGRFRRWYGNNLSLLYWNNGGTYLTRNRSTNSHFYLQPCLTWTLIGSGAFSARYVGNGYLWDVSGSIGFPKDAERIHDILCFMNCCLANNFIRILNPTINTNIEDIESLPVKDLNRESALMVASIGRACVSQSKWDWDAYETSWDFAVNSLAAARNVSEASDKSAFQLSALYAAVRATWAKNCEEMRRLETENNRIFIEAYGLQDELTPEVPWHEITLTCNPWYRYGVKEVENAGGGGDSFPLNSELEERLKTDTVKELVSYAVGCMMGRYSLEKPGLVLADQGASEADYYAKIGVEKAAAKFPVDDDGIIPILDNDWFADDIVTRFREFVKVAFGEENFFANMAWIEEALGKDIRSYFTKDFYKDHLQLYQNRPIYWLFQSPKGAFRALVYMHRYKPDMVGGVLGYLRSLQTKVENQLGVAMQIASDESKSNSERVRANKDVIKFSKAKKELDEYEKNVLYPLSTERIEIDLDDGVKVNYAKLASALAKVKALEAKGE